MGNAKDGAEAAVGSSAHPAEGTDSSTESAAATEAATAKHGGSASPSRRIFRTLYWAAWFVAVPLVLACLLVWALQPGSPIEAVGAMGWLQSVVREQPVPVGIVAFTL